MALIENTAVIVRILVDYSKKPVDMISASEDLFADGVIDSLGILEIITQLELNFSIEIPNEELTSQNFRSVKHIYELTTKLAAVSGSVRDDEQCRP